MRYENFGPVANPDGTPTELTKEMLADTGRDAYEFARGVTQGSNKLGHRWWHAEYVHHHLVCIDCGTGWHSVPDMGAIDHSSGMNVHEVCMDSHIDHYDTCCEVTAFCTR